MGKTKSRNIIKNPLEAVKGYSSDALETVAKTAVQESDTFFADLLGLQKPENHDPKKGEVELFNSKKETGHKRAHIEYHAEIKNSGEKLSSVEKQQLHTQIQEILVELKQLVNSSTELKMEFAEVAVMETPREVGKYQLSFFEWLLITIRQAREKVDNSGAWLSAVKGKSGKKGGGYWDMFKKHGESFSQSSERSSATSVG